MRWEDLKLNFEAEYDYLKRLQVDIGSTELQESLPSILTQSAGVALRLVNNDKTDKLLMWFPARKDMARWLSIITALEVIRNDYKRNFTVKTNFVKGQKLLINGCIVEYIGEGYKEGIGPTITIKYRDNKKDPLGKISYIEDTSPLKEKAFFQPITTNKDVSNANRYCSAIETLRGKIHELDNILDIRSCGNRCYFDHNVILVSPIGDTEDFLESHTINGTKLNELFLWGKLDSEGYVSLISAHKINADPSCLIASDIYGVVNYLANNPGKTKAVIIDGSSKCMDNLQALDEILNGGIKTLVVTDLFDTANLKDFISRDFQVWQWNEKWIKENILSTTPLQRSNFYSFNNSLTLFSSTEIKTEICKNDKIEKFMDKMIALGRSLSDENHEIDALKFELIKIVNEITRLVIVPDDIYLTILKSKLEELIKKFETHKQWINKEDTDNLIDLLTSLKEYTLKPFTGVNDKVSALYQFINKFISDKTSKYSRQFIIVPKSTDVDQCRLFWNKLIENIDNAKIIFISYEDYLKRTDISLNDQIIVCGWLGGDKIDHLLYSFLSGNYVFLLYHQESQWFISAQNNKKRSYEFKISADSFSDLLKSQTSEVAFLNYDPEHSIVSTDYNDFNIGDFELRFKKYQYSKYTNIGHDDEEKIKAKLLIFNQNKFAFISSTHKVYEITDFLTGDSEKKEIRPTLVEDLHENDYVLFRETGRDIIREIADKALEKAGKNNLLELAETWKKPMKRNYADHLNDFPGLIQRLRDSGCTKHTTTIRQWLFDENVIGPHDEFDLDIIAKALNDEELRNNIDEVKNAIREVRSAHLQASEYLKKKLLESLPKLLDNKDKLNNLLNGEEQILNIEGIGQAKLLKVDEVAHDWIEVSIRQVNRLITKEEN